MLKGTEPYIVGVGAANIDICAKSMNNLINCDSNPGHVSISAGGVTRNILENLSRLNVSTKMISAIGTDWFSEVIRKNSEAAGIDMEDLYIVEGEKTSTYIDILDDNGNMVAAVSDMSILKKIPAEYFKSKRKLFEGARLIVMDGCMPIEILECLVFDLCKGKRIFIDTVSRTYAEAVREIVRGCHTIMPNKYELEILAGRTVDSDHDIEIACENVLKNGAKRVVVTLGERGCYYSDEEGTRFYRSLHKFDSVENVTGAGDAFSAGFIYGDILGMPHREAIDFALGASIVAISSIDTINPLMSAKLVEEIVAKYSNKKEEG